MPRRGHTAPGKRLEGHSEIQPGRKIRRGWHCDIKPCRKTDFSWHFKIEHAWKTDFPRHLKIKPDLLTASEAMFRTNRSF
jgi:hypothetical protein